MQYFGFDKPSFAFKTYGFGANPDDAILALYAGGKQGAWYDPSDKSTLFQDVAGTVPVTGDGNPVGKVLDKSGNGNHATQTVSASRPTYRTDGIFHWLSFDGVDDYLDAPQLIVDANFSVFATIKGNNLTHDARYLVQGTVASTRLFLYSNRTANDARSILVIGRSSYFVTPTANSDVHIYGTIRNSSGVLKQRFDGAEKITTGASIAFENSASTIGGISGNGMLNGRMYGMIVLNSAATSDTISEIEAYLARKSGAIL